MKRYKVKEIYYTIQGEGYHAGRAAVFCRFAGCNLWSGLEKDRTTAICKFCDTDFWGTDGVNGGKYLLDELVAKICEIAGQVENRMVVFTGGEPALQLDEVLIEALHANHIYIAIETNGTVLLAEDIDWVCVSPKADTNIIVTMGDELKLVYPQAENTPFDYEHLDFVHYYIQPKDDPNWQSNTMEAVEFVKANPMWKLSVQTHKYIKIP